MISRFAVAVSLALGLAACGSSNQPAPEATASEAVPAETGSTAPAAPTEAAPSETPSAAASTTPRPTPTPTPQASGSAAADESATGAAAASPPQAFNQCSACHSTEAGKTIIGPSLAGVYGRKAGTLPGFQYSQAMKDSGLTWNAATLDRYLTDPKNVVPGTLMGFAGLKDTAQRKAVIDYLKTLK